MSIRIHGNREIQTLPGLAVRPTPVKVRLALFNSWQGRLHDCRWLDLCSGSGAMSAEALCRGAAAVVAIEESPVASKLIRENCQKLAVGNATFRLINGRVQKFLPSLAGQQFDLIYCDPPYQGNLYQRVLDAIQECDLLAVGGEIALEHGIDRDLGQELLLTSLEISRQKTYGSVSLTFLRHLSKSTASISTEQAVEMEAVTTQNLSN
jgi:16S rRNA (guanine966-N2)-methyltransferase